MVTLTKMFSGKKKGEDKEKSRSTAVPEVHLGASGAAIPAVASGALVDTPEENVRRAIVRRYNPIPLLAGHQKGFCESGAKDQQSVGKTLSFQFAVSYRREPKRSSSLQRHRQGEEVLYLPTIVDSAECSPTAAAEAAKTIKKYLDMKYHAEPQLHYNAVMLMRILADNPGRTFTRNLDERFAEKVKELFKQGRDPGVRQLLIETLEHFDVNKRDDEGLQYLRVVWHKQKVIIARYQTQPMFHMPGQPGQLQQMVSERTSSRMPAMTSLPPLEELVGRISEAQMSAKLLHQVLGSTPKNEVLDNELIKEFVHRCRSASTSMADFITCDSPPPDPDTLQTLIETNDIMRIALARYEATKESIQMSQSAPPEEPRSSPTMFPVVDPAARNEGPPDLDNPFKDPAPHVFSGGSRQASRSPAATGRVTRIDTGRGTTKPSPVSPVVRRGNLWLSKRILLIKVCVIQSSTSVEARTGFRY
ncbi:hypothetical protein EV426DRAFT_641343 [Tirmania nivea]|nr:hypothetical protein EV426DRAFT_641343 [Tirmania nivea]